MNSEIRKRNKKMRIHYTAGLASGTRIVPSMDSLCIKDTPSMKENLEEEDDDEDGNEPVLRDNT